MFAGAASRLEDLVLRLPHVASFRSDHLFLIPKDPRFHEYVDWTAQNVHQAAFKLAQLLEDFEEREVTAMEIHDLVQRDHHMRREGDRLLHGTVVTPIDRTEIFRLVLRLREVLYKISAAAQRIVAYRIEQTTIEAQELGQCLRHATALIVEATSLLGKSGQARPLSVRVAAIRRQKREAVSIEQEAGAILISAQHGFATILKWKDVYGRLVRVSAACDRVADVIEALALKRG